MLVATDCTQFDTNWKVTRADCAICISPSNRECEGENRIAGNYNVEEQTYITAVARW